MDSFESFQSDKHNTCLLYVQQEPWKPVPVDENTQAQSSLRSVSLLIESTFRTRNCIFSSVKDGISNVEAYSYEQQGALDTTPENLAYI